MCPMYFLCALCVSNKDTNFQSISGYLQPMEIFLSIISLFFILTVFLSLVKSDFWIYKILEYPRLQKLVLIIIVTVCWFLFWPIEKLFYQLILGGLFISIIYLF